MPVGIVPVTSSGTGGIFQYSMTMLAHLIRWNDPDGFVVFAENPHTLSDLGRTAPGWTVKPLHPPSVKRIVKTIIRKVLREQSIQGILERREASRSTDRSTLDPDTIAQRPDLRQWFSSFGVELMLYPSSTVCSFECGIPYIMGIPDVQHRLQPEFPEVSAGGEFSVREYLYRNGARYATLVFADSEVGKEDILQCYGDLITEDRVKVLPYLPAASLNEANADAEAARVRYHYGLPQRYLFYPAQFWPHKNHLRIIQALGRLKDENQLHIPIVFCGSSSGSIRQQAYTEAMRQVRALGLTNEVRHLGYVQDGDMAGLYRGAVALIFPTFFGPTNIPVLEAWALDCPVLSSDIRGIREQVGAGGILVDPRSVDELANGIRRLWTEEALRKQLVAEGRKRLSAYTPEDYDRRLSEILREARERVRSQNGRMR